MKTYKKLTAILLSLCTLLNMAACADSQISGAEPESTSAQTELTGETGTAQTTLTDSSETAQTNETAAATVTLPPTLPAALIHPLESGSNSARVTGLAAVSGSIAAVSMADAEQGKVYLIDTAADRITDTFALDQSWENVLGYSEANGLVTLLMDQGSASFVYYDSKTRKGTHVDYSGAASQMQYDAKRDRILSFWPWGASATGRDGKETVLYDVNDTNEELVFYDFKQNLAVKRISDNSSVSSRSAVVISASDQKERFRVPDFESSEYVTTAEGLVRLDQGYENGTKYVCNCAVYDLKTGTRKNAFGIGEGMPEMFADPDSPYLFIALHDTDNYNLKETLMFDLRTGRCEQIRQNTGIKFNREDFCWLPELGCWLNSVTDDMSSKAQSKLLLIDPSQADFSAEKKPLFRCGEGLFSEVGSNLKTQRALADTIEKKYSVKILIGDEVYQAASLTEYRLVSTEDKTYAGYDPYWNGEGLTDALRQLDTELGRYPKGFFDLFTAGNRNGLRIVLVSALMKGTDGGVLGVAWSDAAWGNIAVYVAGMPGSTNSTLHHEMFHAVEQAMNAKGFDFADWDQYNPAGFSYYGYDGFSEEAQKYVPDGWENVDTLYFVRDYGMTSALEDRATIAETCFGTVTASDHKTKLSGYAFLMQFPHLKAKLTKMGRAMKECFGTDFYAEMEKAGSFRS